MTLSKPDSGTKNTFSSSSYDKSADDKPSQKNWYAKLHPIGITQHRNTRPKHTLNLSIFFRIWLAVALVLIICGLAAFTQLFGYVKPTAQQVIEDTLLDTSKLMAASLQIPLQSRQLYDKAYQQQLDSAFGGQSTENEKRLKDQGLNSKKTHSSFRVYVTDSHGIVIYDSQPQPNNATGEDYSRWNDVYLTLQGQYGARSTIEAGSQRGNSTMYVAQPIKDKTGVLIGVVSVGKPIASVLPYLDDTRKRMLITALLMGMVALMLAGLVAWWLKQSITLVTQYTQALAEDTKKPYFYLGHELNSLTDTIETMKHRLENRAYVSDYVHTLTHELKSPLTAIRASSELLEDHELNDTDFDNNGFDNTDLNYNNLNKEDRHLLIQAIGEQSIKMQQLIDRLLLLATIEQPTFKLDRQPIALIPLLESLIKDNHAKVQHNHLAPIKIAFDGHSILEPNAIPAVMATSMTTLTTVYADRFWLTQALQNLLDNALYFATTTITINIYPLYDNEQSQSQHTLPSVAIDIFNDGEPLPDYAITKAFDRYFSLSHQHHTAHTTPKKGTGLGLTLVRQVIEHHGGQVNLKNITDATDHNKSTGVEINVILPLAKIH